jgi:hypothetical protein
MAESPAVLANRNGVESNVARWLKSSTPAQRIQMACALNQMAREMVASEIRDCHPSWSDLEVEQEVARQFLADVNLPMLYAKDLHASPTYRDAYERSLAECAATAGEDR